MEPDPLARFETEIFSKAYKISQFVLPPESALKI